MATEQTMTPPLDLEALEALLAKATSGVPEIVRYDDVSSDINYQLHFPGGDINVREGDFDNRAHAKSTANAIAELLRAAPALIAELRAARALIETIRFTSVGWVNTNTSASLVRDALDAYDAATKGATPAPGKEP